MGGRTNGSESGCKRFDSAEVRGKLGILVQLTLARPNTDTGKVAASICWILYKRQALRNPIR